MGTFPLNRPAQATEALVRLRTDREIMPRSTPHRIATLLALATAAATLVLTPALAQSEDEAPSTTAATDDIAAPPLTELARSDTFVTGTWELAVDQVFSAPSPIRHGYTEVRVGVTMKNRGDVAAEYRSDGFFGGAEYPRLGMTDGAGNAGALLGSQSVRAVLPGSMLSTVPPGLTARWTVGFQVPTAYADNLTLDVHGADAGAAFDLSSSAAQAAVEAPEGIETVAFGDHIDWGDDFVISAFDSGSLVCGDPNRQLAMQIVAVGFEVGNKTALDADWPGVRFPDDVAIAVWPDGASARFSFETYAGDFDPLFKWSGDATRVPAGGDGDAPSTTYRRAMIFGVPRDGRLVNADTGPMGLWLQPPGSASALWLDLPASGGLAIGPTLCDEGNLSFAIPFSFGPGVEYAVGPLPAAADPAAQDAAAKKLLAEVLVTAGNYKAANGDSYEGMTAGALAAMWDRVALQAGFVAEVGQVGVSTSVDEAGETTAILVTQSAGGDYICMTDGPAGFVQAQESTLEDITEACVPAVADTTADTTTTTTTVPGV
jgi:hypothetical protein